MSEPFSQEVYDQIRKGCQDSAAAVVPTIIDLIEPETVVDVGGGEGWWGIEFRRHECMVVVLDQSYPVTDPVEMDVGMMVPGDIEYRHIDLVSEAAQMIPFPPSGRYDLAVCLEVAEHLPEDRAAGLVEALCRLAPVVLWSAAIPGQGGHGHLNEQWPDYWANLFGDHDFTGCDILRPMIWTNENVEPWYRQNLVLFASNEWLRRDGHSTIRRTGGIPHALVHPEIFGWRVAERDRLNAILYPS